MLRKIIYILIMLLTTVDVKAQNTTPYLSDMPINYIRTWDALAPVQSQSDLLLRPAKDIKQSTQYIDGLGRPLQNVVKEGSLATGSTAADIVTPLVYDESNREQYKFLPFVANNTGGNTHINDGEFKANPFQQQAAFAALQYPDETNFYNKINFEASPLNRVTDAYAPGYSWAGSEVNPELDKRRNIQTKNWLNTLADSVHIWTVIDIPGDFGTYHTSPFAIYPSGTLYKIVTIDEHKKQVIEFKDMSGQIILKKVQLTAAADNGSGAGYEGWLCTYYIYDDLNHLRCVAQPSAVSKLTGSLNWQFTNPTILSELAFRYEYDARNRIIKKQVPGAGEVWMVYDLRNRLVMTQDANMRNATVKKWLYTTYDDLNRPISTGFIMDGNNLIYHLNAAYDRIDYPNVSSYVSEELTNTFYDDYNWLDLYGNPLTASYNPSYDSYLQGASNIWPYPQANVQSLQVKGKATGNRIKVLGTSNYLYSITFYDNKEKAIQSQSTNITGGIDVTTTQYSWAGLSLISVQKQDANSQLSILVSQITYDNLGRTVNIEKKMSNALVDGGAMPPTFKPTVRLAYDKLGQIISRNVGNKPDVSGASLANNNYGYNIRG